MLNGPKPKAGIDQLDQDKTDMSKFLFKIPKFSCLWHKLVRHYLKKKQDKKNWKNDDTMTK